MIFCALLFLSGILLIQQLSVLPDNLWLDAIVFAALLLAWRRYWRGLLLIAGMLWAIAVAESRLADRLPENLAGLELPISGVIADLPEQDERQARFDFLVEQAPQALPSKLRLSWYQSQVKLKAGQHWRFSVRLKPPHGSLNPGGFDYQRWLFTENIGATGSVRNYPPAELLAEDPPWRNLQVIRQGISDRLAAAMPDSSLIKALTIGDGSGISQAQWDVFRKTGTLHLMVISGSHIGLIASAAYFLVLKFWAWTGLLRYSPPTVAALAAIVTGIAYALLAGFTIPCQRAVVMLLVYMLAIIRQRHLRPLHTLATALFAILIYDPLAVLSSGFWLSFAAVALIVFRLSGRLHPANYWQQAWQINWATALGLSPLLLGFFQQVSLCAPFANFIAIPVIGLLVVPLALVAVALLFLLPDVAILLLTALDYVLQAFVWLMTQMAALPEASVNLAQPSWSALLFAVLGVLLLLAPRGLPNRWLGLFLLVPLAINKPEKPNDGEWQMTLLDVGQGLAVAVQTANHWMIYDTGGKFSAKNDSGLTVLLPFLHWHGVDKVDTLMVSHGDNDHIGGAASLLQAMPVSEIFTSVPEQLSDYQASACRAGQSWLWDGVRFTVLSPGSAPMASDNDKSCVLKIDNNHASVLLTGDIERQAEMALVSSYGEALRADILLAPHHGSKTSSSTSFLQAVKPTTVLIPAGYRNPFGHPHAKVLRRYRDQGVTWLNTADSGAIIVTSEPNGVSVQTWRQIAGKYWQVE